MKLLERFVASYRFRRHIGERLSPWRAFRAALSDMWIPVRD
jgi:hypothetical protein